MPKPQMLRTELADTHQKSQQSVAAKQPEQQTQSKAQSLQMSIEAARKSTTSIREAARIAIDACFDHFWNPGKNVIVGIISFRLKEAIPSVEWDDTTQAMLDRARQEINRSMGHTTEFIWLRKENALERGNSPTYEVVFMNYGRPDFFNIKNYCAIMKRHFLTGKGARCEAFAINTPPRHSAPGYMTVSNKADNLELGKHWLGKLTDVYAKNYVVVGFGCSQIKPPKTLTKSSNSSTGAFPDKKQEPGKQAM